MNLLSDTEYLFHVLKTLITFLPTTLRIAAVSLLCSIVIALPIVLLQIRKVPVLAKVTSAYVLIARACPLMIQIYLVYFGIPLFMLWLRQSGYAVEMVSFQPEVLAIIALSINFGAYISQVLRAALLSVDKGQMEAALAVGMSWFAGFRRIVLPQAACYALPPLSNQFLNLVKSTSILFCISVEELMAGAKLEGANTYRYLEIYCVAALIYWVICFCVERVIGLISKRTMVFVKG